VEFRAPQKVGGGAGVGIPECGLRRRRKKKKKKWKSVFTKNWGQTQHWTRDLEKKVGKTGMRGTSTCHCPAKGLQAAAIEKVSGVGRHFGGQVGALEPDSRRDPHERMDPPAKKGGGGGGRREGAT